MLFVLGYIHSRKTAEIPETVDHAAVRNFSKSGAIAGLAADLCKCLASYPYTHDSQCFGRLGRVQLGIVWKRGKISVELSNFDEGKLRRLIAHTIYLRLTVKVICAVRFLPSFHDSAKG